MDARPSPAETSRPLERVIAALVIALPALYLATERSRRPDFLRWSWPALAALAACIAVWALWMASYRWRLPRPVAALRRGLVVMGATTIVLALAGEAVLRALDDAPYERLDGRGRHAPDPDVGHVYLTNHTQRLQSREFSVSWSSNAQGVRAERNFGPKPPGVVRVLAVGDSFTVGDQVEYGETWPAVMEAELRSRLGAGAVEVVNAGFPGFGTVNEARWIAKFGAAFEPDVVVLAATPNDLLENQFPLQYTARDGAIVSSRATEDDRRFWEARRAWYSLPGIVRASRTWKVLDPERLVRKLTGRHAERRFHAHLAEHDEKATRLFELMATHLAEARRAANDLGATFALVVIPFVEQIRPMGPGLDGGAFGRYWAGWAEAEGVPALDLRPIFAAHGDFESLYWREDHHCNAAGYALIGESAAAFLAEHASTLGLPEPATEGR